MKTKLIDKILQGDVRAAARLMRDIEDEAPNAVEELKSIYLHTGRAYIVGVTGAPGTGKSTIVDALITSFRGENMTVGVVAVDPTSPFTGGALLGDRIRMQKHSTDQGVFIRSLAARGWMGGLSKATINMIHVMDAMNKDVILVETVGIGQAEIDIIRITDTSILVLTPGMGDAIQLMKAGILEGADIFVINKADKDGAEALRIELQLMLEMKDKLPEHCLYAIKAHDYRTGFKPKSRLDKALIAVDSLVVLMEEVLEEFQKTDKQDLKDKLEGQSFEEPWHKSNIQKCKEFGLSLDEFFELTLIPEKKKA